MAENAPLFPGLSPVGGKPVHVAFDGGRLTSDAGVLVLAEIERKLGIAERLARCIEDPRDPQRVRHSLAEMIRFRALLIAAGYADANDCDALRADPAFKLAVGRLPESGRRSVLAADDVPAGEPARRHGAQADDGGDGRSVLRQLRRRCRAGSCSTSTIRRTGSTAGSSCRCSMPTTTAAASCRSTSTRPRSGKPVAVILRPGKTPDGAEVALVLRHVVRAIRARWPAVDILIRGDSHYARHEAMTWLERNRVGYVFGLAGNKVLLGKIAPLAEDAAVGRVGGEAGKVRRYGAFRYAAKSWPVERQVIARVEASAQGSDSRFVVTNLAGTPRWLYEAVYCARGQAENLIKAHKLHLASDRTSCSKATANQFRLLVHTAAYWLLHTLRGLAPQALLLARRPVRHDPARPDQGRRPGHGDGHQDQGGTAIELSLPGQPGAPRRPRHQAAALSHGAACPARARPRNLQPRPIAPSAPRTSTTQDGQTPAAATTR